MYQKPSPLATRLDDVFLVPFSVSLTFSDACPSLISQRLVSLTLSFPVFKFFGVLHYDRFSKFSPWLRSPFQ